MYEYETDFPSPDINANLQAGSAAVAGEIKRAIDFESEGAIDRALYIMEEALKTEPNNPSLYFLAARFLFTKRDLEPAQKTIEHALKLRPKDPVYLKLRGDILSASGLMNEAEGAYRRALKLDGRNVPALNNLGNLLRQLGDTKESTKLLKRALANDENFVPAHYNLALVYVAEELFDEAEKELSACIQLAPDLAEPWLMQDLVITKLDKSAEERLRSLTESLQHKPLDTRIRLQLVKILEDHNRADEAQEYYTELNELDPHIAGQVEQTSRILMNRLEQPLAQRFADMAMKLSDSGYQVHLFMSSYLAVLSIEDCFRNHLAWSEKACADARQKQFSHTQLKPAPGRLKIGYVSPDFHMHAVSFFIKGMLEKHNRDQFEVFCYSHQRTRDSRTEELMAFADHWREIQYLNDYQAASLINGDDIDILVDLSGHTAASRVSLFAHKPAPIQVAYLGYPGSTGLKEMDYWLTDYITHPEDTQEPSTEIKYRLQRCWISYDTSHNKADIELTQADGPLTFGVINHIGKHSDAFVQTWGAILARLPDARLIVKSVEFSNPNLRLKVLDKLESLGIDRTRVRLMGRTRTQKEHFQTYNLIDVCLDPFPYTGGTSTADSLMMGTPVITLTGDALKSRMSTSMLTHLGRPEWIAKDVNEYVNLACEFGRKKISLDEKLAIRDQFFDSELTDTADLTQHIERAFLDMWQKRISTLSPAD